ncbi:uncharacterized protein HD556DRAFT_1447083 [Suillus plorans]|uniref:Uncharacterized protein n=1 Tax=Suillus plorans TaxID=116603 RepID=A0A9P7AJ51_9AGAM|nr:uncharacterized protein HD556DRAFT_1447083 [Suillus plorans]KAG1789468.1 hypothetical protein HD556DRAFT_1447083 [Suillus plorans]
MTVIESYSPSRSRDGGKGPRKSIPTTSQGWDGAGGTRGAVCLDVPCHGFPPDMLLQFRGVVCHQLLRSFRNSLGDSNTLLKRLSFSYWPCNCFSSSVSFGLPGPDSLPSIRSAGVHGPRRTNPPWTRRANSLLVSGRPVSAGGTGGLPRTCLGIGPGPLDEAIGCLVVDPGLLGEAIGGLVVGLDPLDEWTDCLVVDPDATSALAAAILALRRGGATYASTPTDTGIDTRSEASSTGESSS